VLEHPVVEGLKLDASTPTPTETTPTVYRFRVETAPGETTRLHVAGRRNELTTYELTRSDDNQLTVILNATDYNAALAAALKPVLAARRQVFTAQNAVNQTNDRLTALRADEERQRANITALASADKSSRDRFVRDLNNTEDAIASAQSELTTRTAALDAVRTNLSTLIENLQLNETL
jgi:septal ring factor EnvC (AmiA/AmiB activator)